MLILFWRIATRVTFAFRFIATGFMAFPFWIFNTGLPFPLWIFNTGLAFPFWIFYTGLPFSFWIFHTGLALPFWFFSTGMTFSLFCFVGTGFPFPFCAFIWFGCWGIFANYSSFFLSAIKKKYLAIIKLTIVCTNAQIFASKLSETIRGKWVNQCCRP